MAEPEDSPLHGDILDAVVSRIPTVDLISSRHVSSTWRRTVLSSASRRTKPWLLLRLPRACAGFDPYSRTWVPLPGFVWDPPDATVRTLLSRSRFHLSLLQSPLPSPSVSRVDPVVALVGRHIVVAGSTCYFEDAPAGSVETLEELGGKWVPQDPIPAPLETSATWLSVATSESAMYVLSKSSGILSSFCPSTGKWSPPRDVRPDCDVTLSAIAFTGTRLLYAGLSSSGSRLRIWEVDDDKCGLAREVGEMPEAMVGRLAEGMTTLGFEAVGAFAYFYNPSDFREGFSWDVLEGRWESIGRPEAVDKDPTARIDFGCSSVSLDQLVKLSNKRNCIKKRHKWF